MAAVNVSSTPRQAEYINTSPFYSVQLRKFGLKAIVTLIAFLTAMIFLLPFGNMALMSVKSQDQIVASADGPIWPMEPERFTYEGKDYDVLQVPFEDGNVRELALIQKGRQTSQFIDPANPDAGLIEWAGNWRGLETVSTIQPRFENYAEAWNLIDFPKLFRNTMVIAVGGMIGTLLSSIAVAYAFARFPIPGKNIMFVILIGTIILPGQVTLIPTYAFFASIGWTGSWLPLIVPHFFANAYNVFLLRQFFMTLPKELDEAAIIDGANPFQILTRVIVPQSYPAIVAVSLFHFVYAIKDFFGPLLYLQGQPDLVPISVGVQVFNYQYGPRPELVQATSLMALLLPVILFFVAQRFFIQGVVVTGVDK
jgi:multiple sugar transport system permease protein